MKRFLTFFWVGLSLAIASPTFAQQPSQNDPRSAIGTTYRDLQDDGGWVIPKGYIGQIFKQDKTTVLWFAKFLESNQRGPLPRQVVDVLELPELSKSQRLHYAFCMLNGTYDREIFAIVEATDTKIRSQVYQAWRANTKTEKIEPISPQGVACENME